MRSAVEMANDVQVLMTLSEMLKTLYKTHIFSVVFLNAKNKIVVIYSCFYFVPNLYDVFFHTSFFLFLSKKSKY